MNLKRNFAASGVQGYGDYTSPTKMPTTSQAWSNYGRDEFTAGGSNRGMSQYGPSLLGPGMSRSMDKSKSMSGPSSASTGFFDGSQADYGQSNSFSGGFSDYQQDQGDSGYGFGQSGLEKSFGSNYDQGYGFGNVSKWNYGTKEDCYVSENSSFGRGQRNHSMGQGWGQVRGHGQLSSGQNFGWDPGNQSARGQGYWQGQARGRGQKNRGRGRGQNVLNNQGVSGAKRQKGQGYEQGYSGADYVHQEDYSQVKGGRGRGTGRPVARAKGAVRGVGKRATATQVKSVSDNIMAMVTKGRGKGKGRGAAKTRGAISKPSSLMDLVDTACQRKFGNLSSNNYSEEANRLAQFLEFFRSCPDRVNGIQTIGNALTASRLNLQTQFEAEELMFVTKPLFTGVLSIGSFFFTRGLGLSKKAVKHDCFQRAVEMLRTMSVDDIMAVEDCGKEALKAEVKHQSEEDFEAFKTFLSKNQTQSGSKSDTKIQQTDKSKDQQKQAAEMETSDKIRTAAVSESQVAERNFPLADKMMMLVKEMEKLHMEDQGVAMASRFDVLCFKVGISVAALFRAVDKSQARQFNTQPYRGDVDIELICEIYYDGIQVGQGQGKPRKEAQNAAYKDIYNHLQNDAISTIVQGPKLPTQPESLPDYFEVIYKGAKAQEGNNHQRLFSLRAYPPDLTKGVDDLVIIETQGDTMEDNAYKILEFSASKNGMLLEWKQLDKTNTANGFRCEISLNHQKTVTGIGQSKPKARNAAAAMCLTEMYLSQDVISTQDDFTKAIPISAILARAEELKSEGPPRPDRVEIARPDSPRKAAPEQESDSAETAKSFFDDPLRLWIEDAIVEHMENHRKRVTLEELIFGPGFSAGIRKFSLAAARQFSLLSSVRNFNQETYLTFHHRGITPQEMVKILHICKNKSGRYTLVRSNKPFSVLQQAQFARTFPDVWMARARAQLEAERQKKEEEAAMSASAASATDVPDASATADGPGASATDGVDAST